MPTSAPYRATDPSAHDRVYLGESDGVSGWVDRPNSPRTSMLPDPPPRKMSQPLSSVVFSSVALAPTMDGPPSRGNRRAQPAWLRARSQAAT